MAVFPVVLDANVLYGILSTDLLITTAGKRLYRAHWSTEILAEARGNLIRNRPDIPPDRFKRRFNEMQRAMPEALVDTPPQALVDAMTNHPGDRHVLATAVFVRAEIIVTENTKHFSPAACDPYGIETRTLDEFATDLLSLDTQSVWRSIEEMATRLRNPPTTTQEICGLLNNQIPNTIAQLAKDGYQTESVTT